MAVFFLSSRSDFWGGWGWCNGLCSFGVAIGGFCSFGVAGGGLHFRVFCRSKHLKIFYIETDKVIISNNSILLGKTVIVYLTKLNY